MTRDKFLTEKMDECWHDFTPTDNIHKIYKCSKCPKLAGPQSLPEEHFTDFSTWEGFGKLWEWATKQEWWAAFLDSLDGTVQGTDLILTWYINPDRFADAVYRYLNGE